MSLRSSSALVWAIFLGFLPAYSGRALADTAPNLTCNTAINVTGLLPYSPPSLDVLGTEACDTGDPEPLCGANYYTGSVWYEFTAPADGVLTVGAGGDWCCTGGGGPCNNCTPFLAVFDANSCTPGADRCIRCRIGGD